MTEPETIATTLEPGTTFKLALGTYWRRLTHVTRSLEGEISHVHYISSENPSIFPPFCATIEQWNRWLRSVKVEIVS